MTNLDPQTTADFWDAYVRAAGGGATLAQVGRTFAGAPARTVLSGWQPPVN